MEEIRTKCCVNLIENDRCDVLEHEKTTIYNQDFSHGTDESFNAKSEDIDLQSVGYSKSNAINVSNELSKTLNEIHPVMNIPSTSANKTEIICKEEEENFEDELFPITFVAVSPLSVKIEIDKQRSSCVSDSELKDPLEGYPHSFGRRNVIHIKEEKEILSGSEIKIEIKKENDDCELSSKVSDTVSVAKVLEVNSDSKINSISQETKHLCDGLPMSLEGNMLMTTEDIGRAQSKQNVMYERTVNSEDSFSIERTGLDLDFASIVNVSNSDLMEEKQFQNGWDIGTLDYNNDPLTLNGVSETFKCGAEESSLTENERDGEEEFAEPITKRLNLKECRVVLERIMTPYQMKADKHSAFRENSHLLDTEEKKEFNNILEDPETLRSEQCVTVFSSENKYEGKCNPQTGLACNISHPIFLESKRLKRVTNIHVRENQFSCYICDKCFRNKKHLREHIRTHSAKKLFPCNVCKADFTTISDKQRHLRTHTRGKTYSCDFCQLSFSVKSGLIYHKRTHTGEKPFSCKVCNLSFAMNGSLKKHLRTHTGEKPFSCVICNLCFSQKSTLNAHRRIHTGEKPFSCDVCQSSFSTKSGLITHYRTHTGEKPFFCDLCNASFSHMSSLKSHKRSHTGEKPFSCDVCHSSFSRKSYLIYHIRTHTGEKQFSCNVCNLSFAVYGSLKTHLRTHTGEKPFSCVICNLCFSQKSTLNAHRQIHTGEKPFSCAVCQSSFSLKDGLIKHIRTHTGEKPFSCVICNLCFSQKSSLKRHVRTHTGYKPIICCV